ncbi:hypothetical protein GCM10010172_58790 [Paractinoplanes ferrugineus]|uniref:Uncharacterized protein n=1 Tax=Paractinoplanes ferrugineus TaxID=113564 RepID=A0A919MNJ5_9ACTN|nr:hypothetical protein Afe05nite_61820 [Actinoplanes ferrugineus]
MFCMMACVAMRKSSPVIGPPGSSQVGVVTGLLQVVLAAGAAAVPLKVPLKREQHAPVPTG